jgi:hypothetical protein
VFSPYEQLNYLTDAFGLSSFVSPVVKREHFKQEVHELEEKAPIAFTPETRKSKSFLKYTAIFVLALTAAGSIGFKLYQDNVAEKTLVVQGEVQKEVENKIQEATFLIENPMPAVTLTVADEKMPYHVVAGVFQQEENARKALEDLTRKGFKARKLEPNKHGNFPVIYGSYANYKEAWQAMSQIKQTENPDAWLLTKDL